MESQELMFTNDILFQSQMQYIYFIHVYSEDVWSLRWKQSSRRTMTYIEKCFPQKSIKGKKCLHMCFLKECAMK